MKDFINALIPAYLKKMDRYFLLHKPQAWILQFHYVLFFAFALFGLSTAAVFSYPLSKTSVMIPGIFTAVTGILSLALLGFWIRRQLIYSVEKQHGKLNFGMIRKRLMTYTSVFLVAGLIPLSIFMFSNLRVAGIASQEELRTDLRMLENGDGYFPQAGYYSLPSDEKYSTKTSCLSSSEKLIMPTSQFGFNEYSRYAYNIEPRHSYEQAKYLNPEQHLAYIRMYMKTMETYGIETPYTAEEVFERYRGNAAEICNASTSVTSLITSEQKQAVQSQIISIFEAHRILNNMPSKLYQYFAVLAGILFMALTLGNALFVITRFGIKSTLISGAGLMVCMTTLGLLMIVLKTLGVYTADEKVMFLPIAGFIACASLAFGLKKDNRPKTFNKAISGMAMLTAPGVVGWLVLTLLVNNIMPNSFVSNADTGVTFVGGVFIASSLAYFLFLMPLFNRAAHRLSTQPR